MTSKQFGTYVKSMLDERGIRYVFIADKLGMSKQTLYKKMNGERKWTIDEVSVLIHVLCLNPKILLG